MDSMQKHCVWCDKPLNKTQKTACSIRCGLLFRNKFKNPSQNPEGRRKISEAAIRRGTGFLNTPEIIKKRAATISGKGHWNWQGGKTPENKRRRNLAELRAWRKAVFERDNYTCQICGARNGNGQNVVLNADHIKPWSLYPELRLELSNGRTLCLPCHRETDTYMGRMYSYPQENFKKQHK